MIPPFNISGVLPPFVGHSPTNLANMSPYEVKISEVIARFATTVERVNILNGLLKYRQDLRKIGVNQGFQWLDGSFLENVEITRNRPPQDMDLVTFAAIPPELDQKQLIKDYPHLFIREETKKHYYCDAFLVDLNKRPELLVNETRYWFGLFSHQRASSIWKGMLKVDMVSDDASLSLPLRALP